jgi:hypothetical protein
MFTCIGAPSPVGEAVRAVWVESLREASGETASATVSSVRETLCAQWRLHACDDTVNGNAHAIEARRVGADSEVRRAIGGNRMVTRSTDLLL